MFVPMWILKQTWALKLSNLCNCCSFRPCPVRVDVVFLLTFSKLNFQSRSHLRTHHCSEMQQLLSSSPQSSENQRTYRKCHFSFHFLLICFSATDPESDRRPVSAGSSFIICSEELRNTTRRSDRFYKNSANHVLGSSEAASFSV